ncbi:AcrR family transcriptional regulator [Friedmanniella endophytica]|uniref:AcrR family transcriptional regulator n=1 Tax=Microlunatus kandeliicorticis TaxID=1759536 RepID=A0A7W3P608_9ACTN|nr:TetR/AcrR family transcriptional regulator [Microlunatus kandeliicorticis]MBA8794566.1 AcrR family transcriptional regulator [Microlunatus kandeliicorticis]
MEPGDPRLVGVVSERRDRLLDTTVQLLTTQGLHDTTLDLVVLRCGVSHESVRFLFGGFDNLLGEAIEELRVRRHERVGEMLATLPPVGSSVADWMASVDDVARGLIWLYGTEPFTFWEICLQAAHRPELAAAAAASVAGMQDQLAQLLLDAGIERGDLLAVPLLAMIHGVVTFHRVLGRTAEPGGWGAEGVEPGRRPELDLDASVADLVHGLRSLLPGHQAVVTAAGAAGPHPVG